MSESVPSPVAPKFHPVRRLAAETLGTGLLLAIVVGSGIMAERMAQDAAVALLANTVATGAGLVVLIAILGPISGAHFNPAVTLVFALKRELPTRMAAAMAPRRGCAARRGRKISRGSSRIRRR
jgi:glycerol uptake facilitator-like aquaporin